MDSISVGTMKVTIDTREQETIERLIDYYENNKEKYPCVESIDVAELSAGDICTNDNYLGIERKSDKDFISSVQSGRLKQQLYELRHKYEYPLLVVEGYDGIIDCIRKNPQIRPKAILGTVTSSFSHNAVPLFFVNGFYVQFVLELVQKLYDDKKQHYETYCYTPIRRVVHKKDFFKYFVLGLPGIRGTLCKNLVHYFDSSTSRLVNASVEELQSIPGIGKGKAQKIKEVLK